MRSVYLSCLPTGSAVLANRVTNAGLHVTIGAHPARLTVARVRGRVLMCDTDTVVALVAVAKVT